MSENSRVEGILQATIDGDEYTDIPQSRVEELLIELKEVIEEGGGGTAVYSLEEREVGVWIDGRTIYQKTITSDFHTSAQHSTSFVYGNLDVTSFFSDITDWEHTYMNAILDKSFLTLGDGTVRDVFYCDFQNNPSISIFFPFTVSRSGQLTLTLQYVKGDDLP